MELETAPRFFCANEWISDEILELAHRCMQLQQQSQSHKGQPVADPLQAQAAVSPEALDEIMQSQADVHGISRQPEISTVRVYDEGDTETDPVLAELYEHKARLDRAVESMLRERLHLGADYRVAESGHFWYPPYCHMAWHTNNQVPGWRCYLSLASQPGQSFFRYRDPDCGKIVTSMDNSQDLRLFRVDPSASLWHSVYSETDRFSYGYILYHQSVLKRMAGWVRNRLSG